MLIRNRWSSAHNNTYEWEVSDKELQNDLFRSQANQSLKRASSEIIYPRGTNDIDF